MQSHVFPLHRRKLTWLQRNGHAAGIIAGACVFVIGLMSAVGQTRGGTFVAGLAIAAVSAMVALLLYTLGRFLSGMRARDGMVVLQSDRLEITDAVSFEGTVLLLRHRILDIGQPGVEGDGPNGVNRIELAQRTFMIGPEWPNVDIWLAEPVQVVQPFPARPISVTRITMQTPGAAALLAWQRAELMEESRERQPWYEWILDAMGDWLRNPWLRQ